jgi:hypothetical protein
LPIVDKKSNEDNNNDDARDCHVQSLSTDCHSASPSFICPHTRSLLTRSYLLRDTIQMTVVAPHGIPHKRLAKRVLGERNSNRTGQTTQVLPFSNSIEFCFFFTFPVWNLDNSRGNILNCGFSILARTATYLKIDCLSSATSLDCIGIWIDNNLSIPSNNTTNSRHSYRSNGEHTTLRKRPFVSSLRFQEMGKQLDLDAADD